MIGTKTVLWLCGIVLLMWADGVWAQTAGTCTLGTEYCEGVNTVTTTTSTATATNTNVNFLIIRILYCNNTFNMRMRIVIFQFKIFKFKIENICDFWI